MRSWGKTLTLVGAAGIALSLLNAETWARKKSSEAEGTPPGAMLPPPPAPDPALQQRIRQLLAVVEAQPSGVIVNNRGRVVVPPDHKPYNPDGSRNHDFRVVHDTPSGEALMLNQEQKRQQAMRELIAIGRPAVDDLCRALVKESNQYRHLYAHALGEIRDPRAVPALLKYLEDGQMKLKNVAFVRESGDPVFAAQLEADGNKMIQDAVAALQKITGQAYGADLAKWQQWWAGNKARVGPTPNLMEYTASPPAPTPRTHYDPALEKP